MSAKISQNPSSPSWKDLYLDDTMPGHLFLRPSIFVAKSYTWIFSDLKGSGSDALISVIGRIILFVTLPILAALSAVFIPIGLICKLIACECTPPLSKEKLPNVIVVPNKPRSKPLTYQDRTTSNDSDPGPILPPTVTLSSSVITEQDPSQKGIDTPLIPELPPYESHKKIRDKEPTISAKLQGEIHEATLRLDAVEQLLNGIQIRKINFAILEEAQPLLDDPKLKSLACTLPEKGTADPFAEIANRHSLLSVRIKSIKDHYDFRQTKMGEEGEILIDDNGDCLFASFLQTGLDKSIDEEKVAQERRDTIQWITENLEQVELQPHLINSLAEHYHTKIERLEQESEDIGAMLANASLLEAIDYAAAQKRQAEIPNEIELLYTTIIPKITEAIGEAHTGTTQFEPVTDLVPNYLAEMSGKGIHGGAAELYALSLRHQVCIKVYRKAAGSRIAKEPYETMNAHFETTENPARHFTHTLNHYNAYFPPN